MFHHRIFLLGVALVLSACGGGGSSGSGGGGTGGQTSTGGMSTGGMGAGGSTTSSSTVGPTGCPLDEPAAMGTCSVADLRCTYGDNAAPRCRRGYVCQGGSWQVDGLGCDADPPACPDAPGGTECVSQQALCVSGALFCICGPCGGAGCPDAPWFWSCGAPPDTGCPDILPNDGTACDSAGLSCHYGIFCAEEATAKCVNGAWKWDPMLACP